MAFVDGDATAIIELRNQVTPSVLLGAGVNATFSFEAFADLVQPYGPISVLVLDERTIRVDFSGPLALGPEATLTNNYTIDTATAGAVASAIRRVLVPEVAAPDFLIVEIGEMTIAANYTFSVSGLVYGANGIPFASDPVAFIGVGSTPIPELIVATSPTSLKVVFSEAMKAVGGIYAPGSYVFSNGLIVLAVTAVQPGYVELRTSQQDPSILYTVTLTGVFRDIANNAMASPFVTAMLGYQPFEAAEGALRMRIYNFITEVIRLEDQRRGDRFLERFLQGPQEVWSRIYESIQALPQLWNVETVKDDTLKLMKNIVGWNKSLESITDALDPDALRRLVASSVAFWKARGPEDAIEAILRLTTGARLQLMNWFDFRWILDNTTLGFEGADQDPWLVRDYTSKDTTTPTLAGASTGGSPSLIQDLVIPAGDFDGLIVFVGIHSSASLEIDPPKFKQFGAESDLFPLGNVESTLQDSVGRMRLSAWAINGIDAAGGTLDVASKLPLSSIGGGEASLHVIAKTVKSLGKLRDIITSRNSFEGVGISNVAGGIRAAREGDTLLICCMATPLGADPVPDFPMVADAITDIDASSARLATGTMVALNGATRFSFETAFSTSGVLMMALGLPGMANGQSLSGEEVLYQIRIVDNGTLNKSLVRNLAKLTKPIGERIDILYLGFLDKFTTNDDKSQWLDVVGISVVDNGTFQLSNAGLRELSKVNVSQSNAWKEYVVRARLKITSSTPAASSFFLFFYFTDANNYYYVEFTLNSNAGPATPSAAAVAVRKIVAGVNSLVGSATFPDMFRGVYYMVSVEATRDEVQDLNEIRILVDQNYVLKVNDSSLTKGTFGVGHAAGSSVEVDSVEMHFLPAETDYIGINKTGTAIPLPVSTSAPTSPSTGGGGGSGVSNMPTNLNKSMPALNTVSNGSLATAQPIALTPIGYVAVLVNGLNVTLGDGVKTQACYFSADGGATARFHTAIVAGDLLYWNGVIAGYQLISGWRIDFNYNV